MSASTKRASAISGGPLPKVTSSAPTLADSRHFDALRDNPVFQAVLAEAEAGRQRALAAFRDAGGDRLLLAGDGAMKDAGEAA